jgi:hypothetical protein
MHRLAQLYVSGSRQTGRAHILAQRLSDLKALATNGFEEQVRNATGRH